MMAVVKEGQLSGRGMRIGISVSRFNEIVTKQLLDGAVNHCRRSGVSESDLEIIWTPGAFELPLALSSLAESRRFHALIALGCVIRGETPHYRHVARSAADGIGRVMLTHRLPIGFGLLTVETLDQALARCGGKFGNKGREAAGTAIEMANLMQTVQGDSSGSDSEELLRHFQESGWKPAEKSI